MAKYVKKPVVVEAIEFTGTQESVDAVDQWSKEGELLIAHPGIAEDDWHITVPTMEGDMLACPGDFIIRGVKGELYPCKPDVFAVSYEAVNE